MPPEYGYRNDSEMGYIFYEELRLSSDQNYHDNPGFVPFTGPFMNVNPISYWSSTSTEKDGVDVAWRFDWGNGIQYQDTNISNRYAWAVRDGDYGPSVSESQSYTTDYLTLGDTITFEIWQEIDFEPFPYTGQQLDILVLQGSAGWQIIGQTIVQGSSSDWETIFLLVPEDLREIETQLRFVLNDDGPGTDPIVYLKNIKSSALNGSFEFGLDEWSISIEGRYWELSGGIPGEPNPPLDYEEINVSTELGATVLDDFWGGYGKSFAPVDGDDFLIIQAGNYSAPSMDYMHTDGTLYYYYLMDGETWILDQDVFLSEGDIISGYSAFITGDYIDRDRGWVEISDETSTYTIWEKSAGDVYDDLEGGGSSDNWEYWEWQAPNNGKYNLSLNQYGDDQLASWSLYDNIQLQSASVLKPTSVTASDGTYTERVHVVWDASDRATFYEVYRAESVDGQKTMLGSPSGTSLDDNTAIPGETYFYWVKAANPSTESDFSAYDTGHSKILPPTAVAASDGSFADNIRVNWNAPIGATSHKVYRAESANSTKTLLGSSSNTSFNDNSATVGDCPYQIFVRTEIA